MTPYYHHTAHSPPTNSHTFTSTKKTGDERKEIRERKGVQSGGENRE
jgi:hypothetical protein